MAEYPIVIILVQDELVAERLSFVGNVEAKCCRPQTSEEDREVQQVRKLWPGLRGKVVGRQYVKCGIFLLET